MADSKAPAATNEASPLTLDASSGTTPTDKRAELRMAMLKKMRPYPLRHQWVFWHERNNPDASEESWADQLKEMAHVDTIQNFWQVFNNTPFTSLPMRDSLHLFKKNVKPIWEDARNTNGGSWTFRVPKDRSHEFWKEILMLAIGEMLQEVVEKGDDICGVSISIRFNSHLVSIWNRNADNQKSVDAILARVLESLPDTLKLQPSNYYYKKHAAHKSFKSGDASKSKPAA